MDCVLEILQRRIGEGEPLHFYAIEDIYSRKASVSSAQIRGMFQTDKKHKPWTATSCRIARKKRG